MAKTSPILNALNAGEWSPLLAGRTDIQGYTASASVLENFIPKIQGPITRRGGLGFVRAVKNSVNRTWLVPFVKSRTTAYQVEFGDLYCRFYYQKSAVVTGSPSGITGATAASPVVITSAGHPFSDGDDIFVYDVTGMVELNNRWFKVANSAANTYELTTIHGDNVDGTGYTTYAGGGQADEPYEIVSPYSAAALASSDGELNIDFVQTGDVIYITDRAGVLAPRKLSRTSTTSWAFATVDPDTGPWLDINATTTSMYVSGATGTITVTASTSVFTASDIGSLIRIDQEEITASLPWKTGTAYNSGDFVRSEGKEYEATNSATSGTTIPSHTSGTVSDGAVTWIYRSPGYGIARITAQAGTTATATVLTRFPQTTIGSGNVSTLWRKGAWSIANGYPTCVTFFRERLCFGHGQDVYASVAASFEDFSIDNFGEVLAESSIRVTVQSSEANEIVGLSEGSVLIITTVGAEFTLDAPATSEPFGPNNVRVANQTSYGAKAIRPIRVGPSSVFVQASGRKVRATSWDDYVKNLTAPDMTVRASHIALPRITAMTMQEEPHQTIWSVRSDGVLLSFAFDQSQDVRAWARHPVAGTAAVVESVSVIPSTTGDRDDLWVIVSRTINGGTYRYIEVMNPEYLTGDAQEDAKYADALLTYDGTAATTVYGLDHLEGETVGVLADGAGSPNLVVANGEITAGTAASVMQIGLRYSSKYASNNIDADAEDGTGQGKTKRITDCAFRVLESLGGRGGPNEANLDDIPDLTYRAPGTPMGSPPSLFTGDALLSWPGGYETDAKMWYVNDSMFPATVLAVLPQVKVQEKR